ncbi:trans-sulfuration enzyme family protein [Citrobacter braakii]|uniref:trans-sulfuration enzyme family protein n=1 Tax=Citrobacter braakii TaxID=57706 RepID=UPI00103FC6FE|nr:aminotransferase class I/II-fold pyridoxal phosphate-dependent enzyme [Citrobacter braakii]TCC82991.1 aminotransferase class I/II-fold pyridoxal phosphate-dependent enzyme [Citrobacter braakii]
MKEIICNYAENDYAVQDAMICSGVGEQHQKNFGAVSPPLVKTSLFVQQSYQQYCDDMQHEAERYIYSRGLNPTTELLEHKLAALERGAACKVFGSGMGAISATLFGLLKSGDHIILVNNVYGPTVVLVKQMQQRFGIDYDIVLSGDVEDIRQKIKPNTRMIYTESPGTMTMRVVDLQMIAGLAKENNIITAIDNTWATPLFQKPLTLGFDLVLHSCTKYIGGHSDLTAGAVVGAKVYLDIIRDFSHQLLGAVLAPDSAWLVIRGLRTLPLRMRQHQNNTYAILTFLNSRAEVENICHPLMADAKQREIVSQQMFGTSGLISFELKDGSFEKVKAIIDSCRIFKPGCSWGGYESLIISPNRGYNQDVICKDGMAPGLIRISIGQESPEMLIADLENTFYSIKTY